MVLTVFKVRQEHKEQLVLRVLKVFKALLAFKELQVERDHKEQLDLKV